MALVLDPKDSIALRPAPNLFRYGVDRNATTTIIVPAVAALTLDAQDSAHTSILESLAHVDGMSDYDDSIHAVDGPYRSDALRLLEPKPKPTPTLDSSELPEYEAGVANDTVPANEVANAGEVVTVDKVSVVS